MSDQGRLPPATIVIEWENAIDTEDKWAQRAVAALQRELEAVGPRMSGRPAVTYLYDETKVDPGAIWRNIEAGAPRLGEACDLEVLPTGGLTYYDLKNFGISRARTELSIMLDSDAAPQPGWLEGMIRPFADPTIMAVGGITILGHDDLLSRTMALSWIFGLAEEAEKTASEAGIYANNTAVRTAFFRANPFPRLKAFKKACTFWLRSMRERGYGYVRVADARTIHAPHPGWRFLIWRAWMTGLDRDFHGFHMISRSRLGRIGYACRFFVREVARSWSRIIRKRRSVELPWWQVPAAMAIALGFFAIAFVAEFGSAIGRSHEILAHVAGSRVRELSHSA